MAETNGSDAAKTGSKAGSKSSTKSAKETQTERPTDRPMTGILQKDDGRRTEHNLHPLDPAYSGTPIETNKGIEEARKARIEAGLEDEKTAA